MSASMTGLDKHVNGKIQIKLHRDHEGCTGIIGAGDLRRSRGSDGRAGGVDFLVVDSKQMEFDTVLRHAKLSHKGAVLACKNACGRATYGFRCHWVLERGTHVVRSVLRDSTTETIPILILSIEPFDADHHGKQRAATSCSYFTETRFEWNLLSLDVSLNSLTGLIPPNLCYYGKTDVDLNQLCP
ncbi:hypothetical protein GQ457_01G024260 [Hibiscus cannabinus]